MLRNNLKIAWRNLLQKKGFSFLNIAGLAIGMAASLLIGLWIYSELSFNQEFENYDDIAQVMQTQTFGGELSTAVNQPMQLAGALRNSFDDHFKHVITSSFTGDELLTYEETRITRSGNFMEPGITEMLSLQMIAGSRNALEDPTAILLSESTANALFPNADPMGKLIKIGTGMKAQVKGVYKDLPRNSDFGDLTFIAPWELLNTVANFEARLGWGNNWFQTYVQLQQGADITAVSELIRDVKYDNIKSSGDDSGPISKPVLHLHPMSKWHLYSRFENGVNVGGAIDRVWLFGIIGVFILLLACINFMNLSTAKSVKRAKEVGIRKTIGSGKNQLIFQFLSEAFLVVLLAFVISIVLVLAGLPFFNDLTDKTMAIPWGNPMFWFSCLLFMLFTGFIAGSYPAFYLSSFRPASVLKGTFGNAQGASGLRRVLVVFQFTISTVLIIGTITIFKQIEHAKNRPLGYNKEQLLYFPINTPEVRERFETIRDELLQSSSIEEVAASDVLISDTFISNSGFSWKGKDPGMSEEFNTLRATYGFGEMIDWELKDGRNFSREFKGDSLAFIVNESAVRYMGLENPIGEMVKWGDNGSYKIVGVVEDMITRSPYDQVRPTLFILHYGRFLSFVNIKIGGRGNTRQALAHIEKIFNKYDPESLFTYNFIDQEYARNFLNEERMGKLATFFALLAICISCLGIFGLSAFVAEQRTKEIGIRKVLGASVSGLIGLLSREFVVLVLVSCLIAIPTSYYYMNSWMDDFYYRTEISWWIFIAALVGALAITLLTVGYHAFRASYLNPVKSLRAE
ncbi:ABC transporter permease [Poritiphilus flavus]|uniref:FtsX-like permease family protein n=1 Tax=Poritiphilus flavus TaxID=2697053 RepID=A0A6L9EAA0_9FLAO|nr:ABC transporter permease [Poritiphilus flavus]NAS11620.1 FtsX-like permease family protein [Poritiphilus flavus]